MDKRNNAITLVLSGVVIVLISYLGMNSGGLGRGILIAPLFYIVGPVVFIAGIVQVFSPQNKENLRRNLQIVSAIILATIIGIMLVMLHIEWREDHCLGEHGTSFSPEYKNCRSSLF